ncbi:hypothetical protein BD779DRAFT_1677724 [Infundibulicybe gibba]|nr:hypothetical protein BD779DRAFT_1677724 [Infundibulicybe gibba]
MAFLEVQEQIWQRAHLFQDVLVSWKGKLEFGDSSEIPRQVQNVSKNLKTFSEKDLGENFDLLRKWMDDHHDLQDVGMPSRCWAALTSQLKPSEIQHHPPVRDFMAFLDPKFQIDEGVRFLCSEQWYRDNEKADSFFEALDAWIKKNKPDVQSFTRCQTMLETLDPSRLERMRRWYKPFRVFEASLEVRIAGGDDVTEQDPVRDPEYISSSSGSTNKHQWARSSVSLREMRSGHAESTEDGNGMKEET